MSTSISIKELKELDPSSYQIVDIRDAVEISHGAIPGALAMKTEEIETSDAIDRTKKTIICWHLHLPSPGSSTRSLN